MTKVRGALKRVAMELLGWTLVLLGIAALVLPGPGLLMLLAGLVILSQRYTWAEKRVRPVEIQAKKVARDSVQTWPRIAMSALLALGLIGFGVLWLVGPEVPSWWPLDDRWWLPGGIGTGSSLVVSGLVALGLIVYSVRTYRGEDSRDPAAV